MKKTKVLLIFGGNSTEHDVSIISAKNVLKNTNQNKYDIKLAYINQAGQWFKTDEVKEDETTPMSLNLGAQAFQWANETFRPDVMLPILHGKNGEDGMAGALGQLLNISTVGPDMTASAVAMDKLFAKQIAEQNNIKIVPYVALRQNEKTSYQELAQKLGQTIFIKPTRSGSSVGVSKVASQSELNLALNEAFLHDDIVLAEQAISGREIEVAVLGNGTELTISYPGEILVANSDEFYSYDSKYSDDSKTTTTTQAELSDAVAQKIQQLARQVFTALRCDGLSRVDFFLAGDEVYFNEINTLPGFTNISMYPKMIEKLGISQSELISRLIDLAIQKHQK